MENKKGMSLLVECEDCKNKFQISSETSENSVTVTHKKEFKVKDKSIFLTYYDCPSCGRRHFVQIDDAISLSKMRENNQMFVKLSVAKQKDKEIPKKQLAKFKKARKYLSVYRMNLMKQFTGKTIIDETGAEQVLRFSI